MSSKSRDKETYLRQLPETRKWLNECVVCRTVGFKPELPEKIFPGFMAENIRSLFTSLAVNELNICEQCERHWNNTNNQNG
jgi:hypothetical protein